jgi:3-hydroxyisobutyrate dehydrogenase-like beta-hydroxyacid dehydrogenase
MTRVAFLGLGAMGAPMARRILAAGFPLTVWNRHPDRARAIEGATFAPSPREAAAAADVVCTMLSDPAALQAVADGRDGLVAGLSSGKIWLDFSTVTPAASRRAAERAREKGADFCDVPVAGSVKPATDGTLKLLAGGAPAAFQLALMEKDLRLLVEAGGGPARAPVADAARGDYERARVSGLGQKDFAYVLSFLGGPFSK